MLFPLFSLILKEEKEKEKANLEKKRDFRYDNIKGILIFLVVFGHFIRPLVGTSIIARLLYITIFIFHMPTFIYIMGRFSKPNIKRTVYFISLYGIFQVLYYLFYETLSLSSDGWFLTTPVWITWYLLAAAVYSLLSFILPSSPSPLQKGIGVGVACIIAILVGFVPAIGVKFSLSRIFVFLPFFLLGKWKIGEGKGKGKWLYGIVAITLSLIYALGSSGNYIALWHKSSYEGCNSTWYLRALILIVAFFWVKFLLNVISNKPLPILSDMGKHTLFIYLGHGFIVKYLTYIATFKSFNVGIALIASFALVLALLGVSVAIQLVVDKTKNKKRS